MSSSAYDLLTGVKIDGLTTTELDFITKNTFIDKTNSDFWGPILQLSHVLKAARQYGNGLPIPEASGIETVTIADSASGTIKPPGTEVWLLQSINLDNCSAALTDGSGMSGLVMGSSDATVSGPVYLTGSLYVVFVNASGSEQTPSLSYHKVSL